MQDRDTRRIIIEVGQEFGLPEGQALDLFEQYWHEFILRNMLNVACVDLRVIGLGSFFIKMKKIEKALKVVEEFVSKYPDSEYWGERKKSLEEILLVLEKRNEKYNRKRIYG